MCEPATIALIASTGLTVGGTVLGGMGAQAEAKQQEAFARQNALLSRRAAADAVQRGEAEAGKAQAEGSRAIAQARASLGASGLEMTSGSALDALATTRLNTELDAQTLRANAAREAWGYKVEAHNQDMQAEVAGRRADQAILSTILTGGVQAARGGYEAHGAWKVRR